MKSKNPTPIMDDEDAMRSFRLSDSNLKKLKSIAGRLKYNWNKKPSVGKLLTAIAEGEVKVSK